MTKFAREVPAVRKAIAQMQAIEAQHKAIAADLTKRLAGKTVRDRQQRVARITKVAIHHDLISVYGQRAYPNGRIGDREYDIGTVYSLEFADPKDPPPPPFVLPKRLVLK